MAQHPLNHFQPFPGLCSLLVPNFSPHYCCHYSWSSCEAVDAGEEGRWTWTHAALTMNPDHAGLPTLSSSEMPPATLLSVPQLVGGLSRALTGPWQRILGLCACTVMQGVWSIMEISTAVQGRPTSPHTSPAFLPSCSSRCAADGHMLASTFFHTRTPGLLMLLLTLR